MSTEAVAEFEKDYLATLTMICRRIGYGRVMQVASEAWRAIDPIGAISLGPCFGSLAKGDWKPIGTVPEAIKDEQTPILCWTPHVAMVARFDNDEWWVVGSKLVIEATHWMPLPHAPRA